MKRFLRITSILLVLISQYICAQGWQWIETGYPYTLYDLSFPPGQSTIGYAAGSNFTNSNGVILKTTDGGWNWTKISNDTIPGLRTICFTSTDIGYAGGYQNSLLKTTDGGLSWVSLNNGGPRTLCINTIDFRNSDHGIVVTYPSTVFVTTDGGNSWHFAFGIKQTVEDVCFADDSTLFVVGGDEMISKSTTGGFLWIDIFTGEPFHTLYGAEFYNQNYGIVSGEEGKILVTTDGGVNWTTSYAGSTGTISGVSVFNEQTAYVCGTPEQIYKTNDGGITWFSDFTSTDTTAFNKIEFTENLTGLICGDDGKFLINIDYVPVELSAFTAIVENNSAKLNWTTKTELNNSGFEILRSVEKNNWKKIGFVTGSGTSTKPVNYSFVDRQLKNGTYYYKLKQIDFNGSFKYSEIISADISNPLKYNLEQNYPDPFNPSTTIEFSLPENAGNVKILIYNSLGEKIAELVNASLNAGTYKYEWNAQNSASGVYYYELRTDNYISVKKMLLLK